MKGMGMKIGMGIWGLSKNGMNSGMQGVNIPT